MHTLPINHVLNNVRSTSPPQTSHFKPQPPLPSHKSEERAKYDVDRSYRRESLYTERELPNHHHHSGGKPEYPHNPHTRQHRNSEMSYFHHESRDRYYREPRGGQDTSGRQERDGLSANTVLAKRKVSEDPLSKYSGMSRVRREPGVDMAKDRDGGYLMSSPRHLDRESHRSPEGTAGRT